MNINIKRIDKKIGDFLIGRTIGSGTFGKVKEGTHIPTGQKVAIKILQKSRITHKEDLERVHNQLQILYNKIDHPNIIKLLQLHQNSTSIYIITQFIEGKELYESIVQNGSLDLSYCGAYFSQLVSAISYLHSKGICHRDIKPENIMVNGYELKLIDFGLSKQYYRNPTLSTSCGSPCYAAPQMLRGNYNCIKTDVWAMGVTLYAMAVGHLPYQEQSTERLYLKINGSSVLQIGKIKGNGNKINESEESVKQLIRAMIKVDPTLRCSLDELNKNEWVAAWSEHIKRDVLQEQQNDEILLGSMSSYFKIGLKELKQIIEKKKVMSISTYYFLRRRKVKTTNVCIKGQEVIISKYLKQKQKEKLQKNKIKVNQTDGGLSKKQGNTLVLKHKVNQKNQRRQMMNKNKSFTVTTSKYNPETKCYNSSIFNQLASSCPDSQTSTDLKFHEGPFHLNYLFDSLQKISSFVNLELPDKVCKNPAFDSIQQQSENSDLDETLPLQKYFISEVQQGVSDKQYILWKDQFLVGKKNKKNMSGKKGKQQEKPQWVSKYTVKFKGIYLQVKKVKELDMYYLQLPPYFVQKT